MTATATELHVADVTKLAWNAETAGTVEEATSGKPAMIEPKYDGIRLLAHVTENGVDLFTRLGNNKKGYIAHVEAALAARFPVGTWLDGEAVGFTVEVGAADEACEEALVLISHEWGVAQSVLGGNPKPKAEQEKVTFVVFDLIAHGGIDARALAFSHRRKLLEGCFPNGDDDCLMLSPVQPATEEAHEAHLALGFEGSMVKLLDARYASGKRGAGMRKLKPQETSEAVVTDFKPGEGGWTGLVGALIVSQPIGSNGEMVEVTRFSGFDFKTRVHISENKGDYLGRVVEFKHHGQMPSGGYRHPQFHRFRDDKAPEQCVPEAVEVAASAPAPKPKAKAAPKPKAAPEYDPATALMTGRSGSGKFRNFKAMSDEKFAGVLEAVLAEGNDPEAVAALTAEQNRRTA